MMSEVNWRVRIKNSLESKEHLTRNHAAYKGVGVNDMVDTPYNHVVQLPTGTYEDKEK
jgi:hypothetical protein